MLALRAFKNIAVASSDVEAIGVVINRKEMRGMYDHNVNRNIRQESRQNNQTADRHWIDAIDLELIFMNSIAICVILLAIVAADVFI